MTRSVFTQTNILKTLRHFGYGYRVLDLNNIEIKGEYDNCLCKIDRDSDSLSITYRNSIIKVSDGNAFIKLLVMVD
jgi:hypothetical protein